MSLELIGLSKLLIMMYADPRQRKSMLRADLRRERDKAKGLKQPSGNDFYGSFWADAKRHVAGDLDLREATTDRIDRNTRSRKRLYPLLAEGFLSWWEEKRRRRNEPFAIILGSVRARYAVQGLGTIKVENTMSITIGDDGHRIIYPYFCEDPALSDEAARLGLWVMSKCIQNYALDDMRLLDVLGGRSFSTIDTPLQQDEEQRFQRQYQQVLAEWAALRPEYE